MNDTPLLTATSSKRTSLWLMAAAMVFIIGLKSYSGFGPVPWHFLGWPLMAGSLSSIGPVGISIGWAPSSSARA